MDKSIYIKLMNVLKSEQEYIIRSDDDSKSKLEKIMTIYNLTKILDNYDELEPILRKFFNEKHRKEKWEKDK